MILLLPMRRVGQVLDNAYFLQKMENSEFRLAQGTVHKGGKLVDLARLIQENAKKRNPGAACAVADKWLFRMHYLKPLPPLLATTFVLSHSLRRLLALSSFLVASAQPIAVAFVEMDVAHHLGA